MLHEAYKKVPNHLRKFRRIRGLTQGQVAQVLGMKCAGRISLWERGSCFPSLLNAVRLAVLYRTMIDGLFRDLARALRSEVLEKEKGLSSGRHGERTRV